MESFLCLLRIVGLLKNDNYRLIEGREEVFKRY